MKPPSTRNWLSAMRRRTPSSRAYTTSSPLPSPSSSHNPTANERTWRKRDILLRGPLLLARGPALILKVPKAAISRAPGVARAGTKRLFSTARVSYREQKPLEEGVHHPQAGPSKGFEGQPGGESFTTRLRKRWSSTETKWSPIPWGLGGALLVGLTFYKQQSEKGPGENGVKVEGPWQVHVIGALPLRSISRLYGALNATELPVWFRVPGYKFYSYVFGVNLDECEPSDLTQYKSMSEFFMRRLKPGARPIDDAPLVSPADGRVVNFGVIENGKIASVKGATYSLQALLQGAGDARVAEGPHGLAPHPHNADAPSLDEAEFANVNGIQYSLDELIGQTGHQVQSQQHGGEVQKGGGSEGIKDASVSDKEQNRHPDGPKRSLSGDVAVATEIAKSAFEPREGNKLCFAVVYLAPGDYHRYHSPTAWVVERRRHFAGELFSVSPWMVGKLADLFVLNERVALLGRWRYGFFSMIPVGATNVGSIRVNFDSSLRTNSPSRPITPGTFTEATYANASTVLGGQPLRAGDEIGGFWLGSTIVLVFEAPSDFRFKIHNGEKVRVGQALGEVESSK